MRAALALNNMKMLNVPAPNTKNANPITRNVSQRRDNTMRWNQRFNMVGPMSGGNHLENGAVDADDAHARARRQFRPGNLPHAVAESGLARALFDRLDQHQLAADVLLAAQIEVGLFVGLRIALAVAAEQQQRDDAEHAEAD